MEAIGQGQNHYLRQLKKKPLKDINHFEKQKYEIISFSLLVAEHEGQSQENEGETIDIDGSEGIVKKLCEL